MVQNLFLCWNGKNSKRSSDLPQFYKKFALTFCPITERIFFFFFNTDFLRRRAYCKVCQITKKKSNIQRIFFNRPDLHIAYVLWKKLFQPKICGKYFFLLSFALIFPIFGAVWHPRDFSLRRARDSILAIHPSSFSRH